jgi:hypothetical protein
LPSSSSALKYTGVETKSTTPLLTFLYGVTAEMGNPLLDGERNFDGVGGY